METTNHYFIKTNICCSTTANSLSLTQSLWEKATKGDALACLGRFYMNTKQWQ